MLARTPDSHRYDTMWKKIGNRYFVDFVVMACGHGHVLLATEEGNTDSNIYEFVIGGWDNNQTVIRTKIFGEYRAGAHTPDLLTCDRQREFWVSWLQGELMVSTNIYRFHHDQCKVINHQLYYRITLYHKIYVPNAFY